MTLSQISAFCLSPNLLPSFPPVVTAVTQRCLPDNLSKCHPTHFQLHSLVFSQWLALCLPRGPPQPPVPFAELSGVRRFKAHTLNYSTLLLEDERGILYVGARGAIFALNSSDVADGSHHTVSPTSDTLPNPRPNRGHSIPAQPPPRHLRSCLEMTSPSLSPGPLWIPGSSPQPGSMGTAVGDIPKLRAACFRDTLAE